MSGRLHLGTIPQDRLDSQDGIFLIACPSIVLEDAMARLFSTVRHVSFIVSN